MKSKNTQRKHRHILRQRGSRMSLTLVLAAFVFVILLAAIGLTSLGLWILARTGVMVDVDGQMELGSVILFMSLVSIVIGGVIAFFSSRLPLKPINALINQMNRLASGDFKARLRFGATLSSHPAFKEISTSFNTMAEELENTEMLRSDFINNFSHEFKTPIVSITGFAKLLSKGDISEEEKSIYLKAIEEESARLSTMATNVLKLTKIENQTILSDLSRFNLSEQIRSAVLLLEAKWSDKSIDLDLELEEFEIEANEELIKEVWINLIDNAIKFAPSFGTVSIDIINLEEKLCVKIGNTGSVIPEEEQKKIFRKFYQSDRSHSTQGNGIGLAIVNKIVELHRGDISVNSDKDATVFTVILPKKQSN